MTSGDGRRQQKCAADDVEDPRRLFCEAATAPAWRSPRRRCRRKQYSLMGNFSSCWPPWTASGVSSMSSTHALRHALEAVANHPPDRSSLRASSRHDGAFSSLDKVGCDIRSRPLSGRRPQASLNAGSKRSTSRSSQSMANIHVGV